MNPTTNLKKCAWFGAITASFFLAIPAGAQVIAIDSTSYTYTQDFSGLGTGDVTWEDGVTINGVYLTSTSGGVPATVPDSTGGNSTTQAYNMGLSGDSDRALGYLTGSSTGAGITGIQFQNNTGIDGLEIAYSFTLEQWGQRNTSTQAFTLQYKVAQGANAGTNILDSSSWTTLGSANTPIIGDGNSPYELNGNDNQFTISGTETIAVNTGQILTFRLYDNDHSSGDAMVGIDSIQVAVVPEPATYALLAGFISLGLIIYRRRNR